MPWYLIKVENETDIGTQEIQRFMGADIKHELQGGITIRDAVEVHPATR